MMTIKLNTRLLRWLPVLACAGLVLAGCGSHGSVASASQYQAEGKYRSAYIEAKKVLQRDDKNGTAWLLLGKATLMLGNPRDALTDLDKARTYKVPPAKWAVPMGRALLVTHQYGKVLGTLPDGKTFKPKTQAALAVVRGDAYRGSHQHKQAKQAYVTALKLDPDNARALAGMSALAAASGDVDGAHKYVQQALKQAPKRPDGWVAKGDLALSGGDLAGAETAYQKALDLKARDWLPQDAFMTRLKLADVQARQRQFDKALGNIKTLEKMSPQMPQPHYLHAAVLFQQGHLDDAVTQLQKVLKVAPDNIAAQYLMGRVNYAQGNYGQAQMYLSNVMGMDPDNADARKLLALSFYREGSASRALTTLKPVLPGKPSNAQMMALLQRAVARGAAMPHPNGVMAAASARLPAVASSAKTQFADARAALARGDAAKAVQLLKAAPAGKGATARERTALLVMAYVRAKQSAKAVDTAAAWAAKHPHDVSAHLLYGTALVADGKRAKARAQYQQAAKIQPDNAAVLLNLGSLDVMEGHYKDARNHFAAILKHDPHSAVAMLSLGKLALAQHDEADAIKWFKQTIAAAPQSAEAYVRLILLYSHGGRFDQAVATARKLVKARPGDPLALNALGTAEINAGHADKAVKPLQQAVRQAPHMAQYRINLARAQILLKQLPAARNNLQQVIKAHPDAAQAVGMLAFMKLHAGDLPGAVALAHTLQQRTATKAVAYTLEGDLYMTAKRYHKAAAAYQHGLNAHYTRALVLKHFEALNAGGDHNAARGLQQWLDKHGKDASMRMVLAQYYMNHAQPQQAQREYREILKAYPSNVIALNNLAWLYAGAHNPNAVALARKAHKLAPSAPGVADTYAWALLSANQPKAALPILEKAAAQQPKAATIHYHLALAQARTGDKTAARATLEALTESGAKYPESAQAAALYEKLGSSAGHK